jgi:hypothetical protein
MRRKPLKPSGTLTQQLESIVQNNFDNESLGDLVTDIHKEYRLTLRHFDYAYSSTYGHKLLGTVHGYVMVTCNDLISKYANTHLDSALCKAECSSLKDFGFGFN